VDGRRGARLMVAKGHHLSYQHRLAISRGLKASHKTHHAKANANRAAIKFKGTKTKGKPFKLHTFN
jgi:hypothetical protein